MSDIPDRTKYFAIITSKAGSSIVYPFEHMVDAQAAAEKAVSFFDYIVDAYVVESKVFMKRKGK